METRNKTYAEAIKVTSKETREKKEAEKIAAEERKRLADQVEQPEETQETPQDAMSVAEETVVQQIQPKQKRRKLGAKKDDNQPSLWLSRLCH